jgi:Tol biopolymer transport system component/DNA-binding winged helix-turn-helix (wHTH) protein
MMKLPGQIYRFGRAEFDPSNLQLAVDGEVRPLEPKLYRLLEFLLENRGRVVSKDEILTAVWEQTAVTDNALTRAVAQLRKALGDDSRSPRIIETVPTVGYRFIGELLAGTAPPVVVRPSRLWLGVAALMLAATGVAAWSLRSRPEPAWHPLPLTSDRGFQNAPSFSPDGNQVAFEWDGEAQDNFDIYVKGLSVDSTPLRLTSDPLRDQWPKWSPDGRTVAFARALGPDRIALMLIPALGGAERKLAEIPFRSTAMSEFVMAWSADSRWLVIPDQIDDRQALQRISVETGETSRLTDPEGTLRDSFPSVSSDGQTLLFARQAAFGLADLYILPIDKDTQPTGPPRRVPAPPVRYGLWTPAGDGILALNKHGELLRIPAEGTDNPPAVPGLSSVSWADVSRRGDRLVYSEVRRDANVWRLDLTTKLARPQRLIASTYRDGSPRYSPDGTRIAFHSLRAGSPQVWISAADGQRARQLTFAKPGVTSTPSWSPDGARLMVDSNRSGIYQVYAIGADGGKLQPLTTGPSANFAPAWSRDGRWVYFCSNRSGRNEVWKMPDGGGVPVQVTHHGGVRAEESLDGTTLYFSKDEGKGSIWKMPVNGGPEQQLTDSLYRFNFSVTRTGIYYMTPASSDTNAALNRYSFATGTVETIAAIGRPELGLAVSPDGRYLAYAQLDDPLSNLMLIDNFR